MNYTPKTEIAIIGGGYSALVLANRLIARGNRNFIILEKLNRVGKKILATGNGRGNVGNAAVSAANYHGERPDFVSYAINRCGVKSLYDFYDSLGVLLTEENGRIYPMSLQANGILDALRARIPENKILTDACVTGVEKVDGGYKICAGEKLIFAKKVVFAFGGASQKQFGTDGSSFALASALGHRVTRLSPSLVQLKTSDAFIRNLQGVKVNASVALLDGGRKIRSADGDLLFARGSVSGNTVFALSACVAECKRPVLKVDFIPKIDDNRLISHLFGVKRSYPDAPAAYVLCGAVHSQIARVLIKGVTSARTAGEITDGEIKELAKRLKSSEIAIDGTLGFDYSQVTHGGIDTSEFDGKSFESKLHEGLYAIGEALDVDGDCGGYNLFFAFASATCAAEALCRE